MSAASSSTRCCSACAAMPGEQRSLGRAWTCAYSALAASRSAAPSRTTTAHRPACGTTRPSSPWRRRSRVRTLHAWPLPPLLTPCRLHRLHLRVALRGGAPAAGEVDRRGQAEAQLLLRRGRHPRRSAGARWCVALPGVLRTHAHTLPRRSVLRREQGQDGRFSLGAYARRSSPPLYESTTTTHLSGFSDAFTSTPRSRVAQARPPRACRRVPAPSPLWLSSPMPLS